MTSAIIIMAFLAITPYNGARGEGVGVCRNDVIGNSDYIANEYMCLSWSVGSGRMEQAQREHRDATNEHVIFGVGSYGSADDATMGKCYKFSIDTTNQYIIGQVTNYGSDVSTGQFDMQMGAGGFGIWNACASEPDHVIDGEDACGNDPETEPITVVPLFSATSEQFGQRCGGQTQSSDCEWLPGYPTSLADSEKHSKPSLNSLCTKAFHYQVRNDYYNAPNPIIQSGERITCPDALIGVTQLRRSDDITFDSEGIVSGGMLTSTMDCCAPAGSYEVNTHEKYGFVDGYRRIIPCEGDGYTLSTL